MIMESLYEVLKCYFPNQKIDSISEFGNGHIQSTFKVDTDGASFILQKLNTNVFPQPLILISNHLKIQSYLESKRNPFLIPILVSTVDNKYYHIDAKGDFWRLTQFIKNTYSLERTENPKQAKEAAKAYSWFVNTLSALEVDDFDEVLPNFHSLTWRLRQFDEALSKDSAKRKEQLVLDIEFYNKRRSGLLELEKLIVTNQITKRIVHNDTKINNVLFENKKAIAVIDLDTTAPGTILYDYGDALRTIANTTEEDEEDYEKVSFDFNIFKSFTDGYLSKIANSLNKVEKENLFLAPIYMTYIIGLRFLTDYLNGDIYYKIKKTDHNLIRSRVQQKLILSIERQQDSIKKYLESSFL